MGNGEDGKHLQLEKLLQIPVPIILSNHFNRSLGKQKPIEKVDEENKKIDEEELKEKKEKVEEIIKRDKWGRKIRKTNDFSRLLRKHIPSIPLNRMIQPSSTSEALQFVTDVIIDYPTLDLFLYTTIYL